LHHKSTFPRSFSLCPVMYNFWVPFPIPQISYNLFFSEVGDVLNLLSVSFIFCIRVSLLLLNFIFPIYCVSSLIWFKCFVFDATVFQVVVVFLSCYFLHCVFFFFFFVFCCFCFFFFFFFFLCFFFLHRKTSVYRVPDLWELW